MYICIHINTYMIYSTTQYNGLTPPSFRRAQGYKERPIPHGLCPPESGVGLACLSGLASVSTTVKLLTINCYR